MKSAIYCFLLLLGMMLAPGHIYAQESRLVLIPPNPVIMPGEKISFKVALVEGEKVEQLRRHWKISTMQGAVSGSVYTAPQEPGTYLIFAEYQKAPDQPKYRNITLVTVKADEDIAKIELPPSPFIVKVGETVKIPVKVYGASGKVISFRPAWGATKAPSRTNPIQQDGNFSASVAGEYQIVVWGPIRETDPKTRIESSVMVLVQGDTITSQPPEPVVKPPEPVVKPPEPVVKPPEPVVKPPEPVLAKIKILPEVIRIKSGEEIQFAAQGYDSQNKALESPIVWAAQGGSITPRGIFTAGQIPGRYTIQASSGTIRSTAIVDIILPEPPKPVLTKIKILPETIRIKAGETIEFAAQCLDAQDKVMDSQIAWAAQGGSITPRGIFTAGQNPGRYTIQASSGTIRSTAVVEIILPEPPKPVLTKIKIYPEAVHIQVGEEIQFAAQCLDAQDKTMEAPIVWTAQGGSITPRGIFTAGEEPGKYTIQVSSGSIRSTAIVDITLPPSQVSSISIAPESLELKPGETVSFQVKVLDQYQTIMPIAIHWQAEGGTISPNGQFTAGQFPGDYKVQARAENVLAVATIKIVPPPPEPSKPTFIEVTPDSQEIKSGEILQFKAQVFDQRRDNMDNVPITWQAQGGTITQDGKFTAGPIAGVHSIQAKAGEITRTVSVKIVAPEYQLKIHPENPTVQGGGKIIFSIRLYYRGQEQWFWERDLQYSAKHGYFFDNVYTAPNYETQDIVTISHPQISANTAITVKGLESPKPNKIELDCKKESGEPLDATGKIELNCGDKIILQAVVKDQYNKNMAAKLEWQVVGGTLDNQIFQAGNAPGTATIKVIEPTTRLIKQLTMTIVKAPPPTPAVVYELQVEPQEILLSPNGQQFIKMTLLCNKRSAISYSWEYNVTPDIGKYQNGMYIAPDTASNGFLNIEHSRASIRVPIRVVDWNIQPNQLVLKTGQVQKFAIATSLAEINRENIIWNATGGSITSDGTYTAGTIPGRYLISAQYRQTNLTASSYIQVVAQSPKEIKISPETTTLQPSNTLDFHVQFDDQTAVPEDEILWSATGGTIDSQGNFSAGERAGNFEVRVMHISGQQAIAKVKIVEDDIAAQLILSPNSVSLAPNTTQTFEIRGITRSGQPAQMQLQWQARFGTITQQGVYTATASAGATDEVTVFDTRSKLSAKAIVALDVEDYTLKVYPGDQTVVPGANIQLKGTVYYKGQVVMSYPWDFRYISNAGMMIGAYGQIWIAPSREGDYTIRVTHPLVKKPVILNMSVRKFAKQVERLAISAPATNLLVGQSYKFKAIGYTRSNETVECNVLWRATGGKITSDGTFTAGNATGSYAITAQLEGNSSIATTIQITISQSTTDDFYRLGFNWGIGLRQSRNTTEQLRQFFMEDLFFRSLLSIYQFKQGFIVAYGSDGSTVWDSTWRDSLFQFGILYGQALVNNSIAEEKMVVFLRTYVIRLSTPEQTMFKRGFIQGYADFQAVFVYDRLLEEARK